MNKKDPSRLFVERLSDEFCADEKCFWLSFCDPSKPDTDQFLGVVIMIATGIALALSRAYDLGINPGGEVNAYEIDRNGISAKHFNKLLSKQELVDACLI